MVAVLDANCILDDAGIVVDDYLCEFFFKVDQMLALNSGQGLGSGPLEKASLSRVRLIRGNRASKTRPLEKPILYLVSFSWFRLVNFP